MSQLFRYVFQQTAITLMSILGALVSIIWVSQALRELDLVTNKGQSIELLFRITLLTMPSIIMIILPVALFIACLSSLNKLQADSEWVVMAASGASPLRLAAPFIALGAIVATLVAWISLDIGPSSQRDLRHYISSVRADLITNAVRPGQFITLDEGVVFHLHARAPNGTLSGIFLQDRRDPALTTGYFAQAGKILKSEAGSFLIMDNGVLHRSSPDGKESQVTFESYAIDLSEITQDRSKITYKPRERSTWSLIYPDEQADDYYVREARPRLLSEFHDRMIAPLYAFVLPLLAFVFLGKARTTRQNRLQLIAMAVIAALGLRILGFVASGLAAKSVAGLILGYGAPLLVMALSVLILFPAGQALQRKLLQR